MMAKSDFLLPLYAALPTSFAVAPMDYGAVSTLIIFDPCETRQCMDITIINDGIPENTESFFVTLVRTSDLDPRITLDPVAGETMITDNDGTVLHNSIPIPSKLVCKID